MLTEWGATGWPELDVAQRYRDAMLVPGAAHSSLEYYRWLIRSLVRPDGMRYAQRMRTEVRIPVLHLQGELDSEVAPSNADRIAELTRARKPPLAADVVKVAGVNHLLAMSVTGEQDEYEKLPLKQVSPAVSTAVVDWLKKTLR